MGVEMLQWDLCWWAGSGQFCDQKVQYLLLQQWELCLDGWRVVGRDQEKQACLKQAGLEEHKF
jgi:hypothetical protein